jgi:LuxR family transcriptional regulator, quorum-sensing system regulator BjaR1
MEPAFQLGYAAAGNNRIHAIVASRRSFRKVPITGNFAASNRFIWKVLSGIVIAVVDGLGTLAMAAATDYAKLAFDLIDDFDRLDSPEQVLTRFSTALSAFGYSAFLVTGVPEPPQRLEPYILLNGWPRGWSDHYVKSNYYKDDPVAAWARRSINPFEWSEVPYDRVRSPRAAEVMDVAYDFGLKQGFLVPIIRGNGHHACFTMAGERPNLEPRAKRAIHLASMYAHARCASLLGLTERTERGPRILSGRERDVLLWVAEGKSSWEIGRIIGVAERTVVHHVDNAMRKLDAVNRTHAVMKAMRSGEI